MGGFMLLGILVAIGVVIIMLLWWCIATYNGLVTLRNRYQNSFSQISVQLKRRHDLIPNLVETAKAYMSHERGTLEAVTQARNIATQAGNNAASKPGDPAVMKALSGAENQLGLALGRLMMVAEAYPDLKANQNMLSLQEELSSTENKVSFSRQAYNDSVMAYNVQREVFPASLIAGGFSFLPAELFELDNAEEKNAPKVNF
jgi:LemA protein